MTLALIALCIWNIFLTFVCLRTLEQRDKVQKKFDELRKIKLPMLYVNETDDFVRVSVREVNYDPDAEFYGEDFHPV